MSNATEAEKIVRRVSAAVDWSYLIARGTMQRADGRVPVVGIAELEPKRFARRLFNHRPWWRPLILPVLATAVVVMLAIAYGMMVAL